MKNVFCLTYPRLIAPIVAVCAAILIGWHGVAFALLTAWIFWAALSIQANGFADEE